MTSARSLAAPAETVEIAGRTVALHYGDAVAEYRAALEGALVVDRSARTRLTLGGSARADTLTGLVTNDVKALAPGYGQYAAALTPKGKILADVRIFARDDELLVDAPPRAGDALLAMVRKYVNPRVTPYADRSAAVGDLTVIGPHAARVVATVLGVDEGALAALAAYAHVAVADADASLMIARVPDAGIDAFACVGATDALARLGQRLLEAGARAGGLAAFEVLRVEAARPEWGIDIDGATIPQEAGFDEMHAISYTKGCYTGQETVARVHFRGHVNRHLRGLRLAREAPHGARLVDDAGKDVGDVRSAVVSPSLGPIALAMVRREVEPDTALHVRWEGGETTATVVATPFGRA